jgi:putative ABC transport system substrate-binding protein
MTTPRAFLGTVAVGLLAAPFAARAQQSVVSVIGYLGSASHASGAFLAAFRQGLKDSGYVEGANVAIEFRWAEGRYERLPSLASDLVRRRVSVIVTSGGNGPALGAKAATATIPIVFLSGGDPVRAWTPAQNLTSTRHSRPLPNRRRTRSSSGTIHSS